MVPTFVPRIRQEFSIGRLVAGLALTVSGALVLNSTDASAFTPTRDSDGRLVHWAGGSAYLPLVGNPSNRSGILAGDFFDAVIRGLHRWERAAQGAIRFDYWQGTDPGTYGAGSTLDQFSRIYFTSQSTSSALGPSVLGLTQVWYDTQNGEILETDIALNDLAVQFTMDPRDTSGAGPGVVRSSLYGSRKVYLENVLTHELGHAFGLSHSGSLFSTMLALETPEEAHLSCDDQVGIQSVFGRTGGRGRIAGSVRDASGRGVFGAHVQAISIERGVSLASTVSGPRGDYVLDALEPGSYTLMIESVSTGVSSLSGFFAGAAQDPCVQAGVARTFLKADSSGSVLSVLEVPAGGTISAPAITIGCGGTALAYSSDRIGSWEDAAAFSSAPSVVDGTRGDREFALVDRFQYSLTQTYKLSKISGRLEVHALGASISAAVVPRLSLLDASGRVVGEAVESAPVDVGSSGMVNPDSKLVASNLASGDYFIQVRYQGLSPYEFPGGGATVDSIPFVVLTGVVGERQLSAAGALADQARCRMSEGFAAYSSPGGGPARSGARASSSGGGGGFGFCGTPAGASERGSVSRMTFRAEPSLLVKLWVGFAPWVFGLGVMRLGRVRLRIRQPVANL